MIDPSANSVAQKSSDTTLSTSRSLMINHQFRCIFVHIPKTAGKSINRFFRMEWQKHKDLSRYSRELQPQLFSNYFSSPLFGTRGIAFCPTIIFKRRKAVPRMRNYSPWITRAKPEPFGNGCMRFCRIHFFMKLVNGVQKSVRKFIAGVRKWTGSA